MIWIFVAVCNYTSTYADGFTTTEADYQPKTLTVCGGNLYLLYHGGCPDRGLYLLSLTDDITYLAGDNHGSESSIACKGDTLFVAYYHFGDSAVVVKSSYDGGRTWANVLGADSSEFGEDEPTLLLLRDTLYLTFVYEISGPEIQYWKVPISGGGVARGSVHTPYISHNGPMLRGPNGDLYLLAGAWDIEGGGYVFKYNGLNWYGREVLSTGMPYDLEVSGDSLILVAGVYGPRYDRDVVVCLSDTSLTFTCTKVAENVGRVTNVDLVVGDKFYIVWSDNSGGRFKLRMFTSYNLAAWNEIPLDGYLPSDAQTYYPVANLYKGDLYVAYTTDVAGRPSVQVIVVGAMDTTRKRETIRKYCGYYDVGGRRVRPSHSGIRLGCEGKYLRR